MLRKIAWLALLPVILFSSVIRLAASEVTLKNGDRISGKIVEETAESVTIETGYAGKLTIGRAYIEAIADEGNAEARGQESPKEAAAPPPSDNKAASTAVAFKQPNRIFGGGFKGLLEGWEGNANVGFSFTSGNSNSSTMSTGIRAVKSGGRDNLTVYARSLWHSNRGNGHMVTLQNAFWGGARYDRNVSRNLFGFLSYDFERDRPRGLNLRSVAGSGIGRHVVRNETTEMDLLVGGAWNRTWQAGENTNTPEAIAGINLKHRFHERLKLQNSTTFYQNVTDRGEYRVILDTTLSADVTKRVGVFITVGDRFNNDPYRAARRNDFLFTTGMKWNFGRKR